MIKTPSSSKQFLICSYIETTRATPIDLSATHTDTCIDAGVLRYAFKSNITRHPVITGHGWR